MSQSFTHQTVLVTGASRGIGRAAAERFAAAGARVVLVARNQALLEEVAAGIGERAIVLAHDLSDPQACREAVAQAVQKLGAPIDVLVANAGILRRSFIEDVSVEDFEESFRTNAGGALWLTQAVLGSMRERNRGSIVIVASELGLIGAPSYATYCMSKFAMVGLAEVLDHELSDTNISVAAVCPGNVATDQFAEEYAWGPSAGATPEKALSTDSVADTILRAAAGEGPVIAVSDTLAMRASFAAMFAMPRRLRTVFIRDAYKGLLKHRRATQAGQN